MIALKVKKKKNLIHIERIYSQTNSKVLIKICIILKGIYSNSRRTAKVKLNTPFG